MSHIVLISGSHRPTGNSGRIAHHIEAELQKRGHTTYLLNLATTEIPFWDEGLWGAEGLSEKWATAWAPHADQTTKAEGLVIIAPEYHGMVPSKLTNLLLLLGNGAIAAHKPTLLASVSSSVGGAYVIQQLRGNGSKNNRMLFLPEHLIFRDASNLFTPETKPEHQSANAYMQERLEWALTQLEDYIPALNAVRAAGHTQNEKFANGM